ncbi:MAG: hypothetical protein RLZZ437_3367 [Pseudomonadota bacterium]|jgi:hypothetical protein
MTETFPYGQNLATPELWVGNMTTKSRTWLVSYDGSLSFACGYHSFIFLGLESLNIALVNLVNCGPSVSLPVGKLWKGAGAGARTAERAEEVYEQVENGRQTVDGVKMELGQNAADTGIGLYHRMLNAIPTYMEARTAFSLNDLAGMVGSIAGGEIELIGAAALYTIEGTDGLLGPLIFQQSVGNVGDGLVSAGIGAGVGIWSLERWHNLYLELGVGALARCRVENRSPSYDQPYMQIPNIHAYLARLPPMGCSVAEAGFNPQAAFQ